MWFKFHFEQRHLYGVQNTEISASRAPVVVNFRSIIFEFKHEPLPLPLHRSLRSLQLLRISHSARIVGHCISKFSNPSLCPFSPVLSSPIGLSNCSRSVSSFWQ